MNHRTSGLKLEKAITGFPQHKTAGGCSPSTLVSYTQHLQVWGRYAGDVDTGAITAPEVRAFLTYLRTTYKPKRFSGSDQPISAKTLRNYWITVSAFFTWASTEFGIDDPMRSVPAPHFEEAPVEPFSKEAVAALLKATDNCRPAQTDSRRSFVMRRASMHRDRAMILILLDTGLRASELCAVPFWPDISF